MKESGLKSFNKVINIALLNYLKLQNEVTEYKQKLIVVRSESAQIREKVLQFQDAFKNLTELNFDKPASEEKSIRGKKLQSKIGECEICGADDEPIYEYIGEDLCESCLP